MTFDGRGNYTDDCPACDLGSDTRGRIRAVENPVQEASPDDSNECVVIPEPPEYDPDSVAFRSSAADAWIETYTGKQFFPLNPNPDDVCIEDIAHALANKCRFTGHVRDFYSVAQHSVLASLHCKDEQWALMHDAAEAYLPDVARPIKDHLRGFREIEDRVLAVIAERYGLEFPFPESVHEIDKSLLMTERKRLMANTGREWLAQWTAKPLPVEIIAWTPGRAENLFLMRFRQLFEDDV